MDGKNRIAVVMAGGSGERFWPLSTPNRPKQLLKLTSQEETMLEEAVNRVEPLVGAGRVFAAVSTSIEKPVRDAALVPDGNLWVEPTKRNTLGALCWMAANLLAAGHENPTVAVLTADHRIGDAEAFRGTVESALELAEAQDAIVTIGIEPTRAETGYGYIEADLSAGTKGGHRSRGFREKPDIYTAEDFLRAGNYFWNSGMFFFPLQVFLRELEQSFQPGLGIVEEISAALVKGDTEEAARAFSQLPSISVDYAVMEKARNVWVVPAAFEWDDMGAWDALKRSFPQDIFGNVILQQGGPVRIARADDCVIVNDGVKRLAVIGLKDVIVVAGKEGVLVCGMEHAQLVRDVAGS